MVKRTTRREMLAGTASAGAAAWLAGGVNTLAAGLAPSEKVNVAFIGSGGQAGFSLEHLADHNIVALCDVDERRAAEAFERFPEAKRFRDYRRMLDQQDAQIDAVMVAT